MNSLLATASFASLLINRALAVLKGDGAATLGYETLKYARYRLLEDLENTLRYVIYCKKRRKAVSAAQKTGAKNKGPLISIVMPVHDPSPRHLEAALDSVKNQVYPHWQLCIIDDGSSRAKITGILAETSTEPRVLFKRLDPSRGIAGASQAGLELATGEFVGFLDHDDVLEPDALLLVARKLNKEPGVDLLYTDEDRAPLGLACCPISSRTGHPTFCSPTCTWAIF
ncbi:MAG: glycosyltransferase [Deltaproteobacteria bacterium]|nr:glycosyltransferase [Deltaproteobacteria bacterium]